MEIDLSYDKHRIKALEIVPEASEDPDELYDLSQKLMILNPAIRFSTKAKAGAFNNLNDEQYELALNEIKTFSELFRDADNPSRLQGSMNIFELLERLLYFYLRHISLAMHESFVDVKAPNKPK